MNLSELGTLFRYVNLKERGICYDKSRNQEKEILFKMREGDRRDYRMIVYDIEANITAFLEEHEHIKKSKKRIDENGNLTSVGNPIYVYEGIRLRNKYRH